MGCKNDPGAIGERIAADYMALKGYRIVERNFRYGHLEIDLIVREGDCLAFVEVKTRRSSTYGGAVESVKSRKISNVKKAARCFISKFGNYLRFNEIRFDLVAIDLDYKRDSMLLTHLKGIT